MPKLTDAARAFIVQELACFRTPSQVAAAVKDRFGVEISRQLVEHYDPAKNLTIAKKWRTLHEATRRQWSTDLAGIAVAHKRFRVVELYRIYRKALQMKHLVLAAQLLEQIAKEMGDAYTNRRIVEAGDPTKLLAKLLGLSEAELRATVEHDDDGE